jgi:hypothetical protein
MRVWTGRQSSRHRESLQGEVDATGAGRGRERKREREVEGPRARKRDELRR